MTDHEPQDRKLLELATSRALDPAAPPAAGPGELRSAWLALGRALDQENADFREADFLVQLQSQLGGEAVAPKRRAVLPKRRAVLPKRRAGADRGRVWPALLASAVALSVLVIVMRSSWIRGPESRAVSGGTAHESAVDQSDLAWSDALDEQLDAAAWRVNSVADQGDGVDHSLANLADHLESLSDELSTSSL
jgi:hypothetical protein